MNLDELNSYNKEDIIFIEQLYTSSFPEEERRPFYSMIKLYNDRNNIFNILIIKDNNKQNIGFLSYWDLGEYYFIEHFSISDKCRNQGYGKNSIKTFIEQSNKPVILEAELPITEIAQRRINFYQRLNFNIWDKIEYKQPSYYNDGKSYPMHLLSYGLDLPIKEGFKIIKNIHETAYKYKN